MKIPDVYISPTGLKKLSVQPASGGGPEDPHGDGPHLH